MTPRFGLNSE